MGVPEGEEREMGTDSLFKEIIAKNFPNLGKELDIHSSMKLTVCLIVSMQKRPSLTHIILNLSKVKDTEI